ncbi:unnamed protein product [Sympodiomycopsis kandeliae]
MLGKRSFANLYSPSGHEFSDPSYTPTQSAQQQDRAAVTSTSLPSTPRSCRILKPAYLTQFFSPTTSPFSPGVEVTSNHYGSSSASNFLISKRQKILSAGANSVSSGALQALSVSPVMEHRHRSPMPSSPSMSSYPPYTAMTEQAGPSNSRMSPSPPPISSATRMDTSASDRATATAFQLPPLHRRPKPHKTPAKTLSLHIPAGLGAYGGLSNPPVAAAASSAEPISQEPSRHPRSGLDHQPSSQYQSVRLMQAPKSARKRPNRLDLSSNTTHNHIVNDSAASAHSVPSSPTPRPVNAEVSGFNQGGNLAHLEERGKLDLRLSLTGKPRRRPSMPFGQSIQPSSREDISSATGNGLNGISSTPSSAAFPNSSRPPEAWRDPSEHILSGKGSTLQHARSVYAAGPIEVLPGLFLGDEHNAKDDQMLAHFGITTILNVAKETVLPIQSSKGVTDLRQARPGNVALKSKSYADTNGNAATSTRPAPPTRAFSVSVSDREQYYTPVTSRFPPSDPHTAAFGLSRGHEGEDSQPDGEEEQDAFMTPVQQSPVAQTADDEGPYLLRNISSTPNLQSIFDSNKSAGETNQPRPRPATAVGTASSSGGVNGDTEPPQVDRGELESPESTTSSLLLTSEIELPADALTLSIPANPSSGRVNPLRYIKLPWTHDQTELAMPTGGFAQGCAVIADAMGVDYYGRTLIDENGDAVKPSKVLVHCQCGVSRSATLVIAFVMQAAALNYPWDTSKNLTGMHDCYNLVKELSSSISPNISLIYQLVEWERHLSAEANRLREALKAQSPEANLLGLPDEPNAGQGGWTVDVLDEEEWTRMRREEEAKEEAEEQLRKEKALREAEQRKHLQRQEQPENDVATSNGSARDVPASLMLQANSSANVNGSVLLTPTKGLGARRAKKTPSLRLGNSASSNEGNHDASITPVPKTPHALGRGRGALLASKAPEEALESAKSQGTFNFPAPPKAFDTCISPCTPIGDAPGPLDGSQSQYADRDHDPAETSAESGNFTTPTLKPKTASIPPTPVDPPSSSGGDLLTVPSRRSDRPQSLYATLPSGRGSGEGLEHAGSAVGMRYSNSSGSQQQQAQGPSTSLHRHSTHAPSSFYARGHRGMHASSSSISSLQSIHGTLSASSSTGQVVSPKANFGISRGLTSAERKLQHRRTFSSEANQYSTTGGGLINWDQIRGAVAAAKETAEQS